MKIKFKLIAVAHKSLFIISLCLTLTLLSMQFSFPSYANPSIGIYIDSQPLTMDVPPVLIKGRTLVPILALGNALNCKVSWNEKNQSVIIRNTASIARLSIGSKLAYINDNPVALDYPATIMNGRTMVPLSFVAKSLNYDIKWDPILMNVYIKTDTRNMSVADSRKTYDDITVIDPVTLKMNINGKTKIVKLNGVDCAKDNNHLLPGGSACISEAISNPKLQKIREMLAAGDVSVNIIKTLDNDTVTGEIYIDGTSLSQLLIELGYVVEIN